MAQRELDIIARARITLNDVSEPQRWSNERLMELLSEGQDAMCKDIPLVTTKATITTSPGQEEYNLPLGSVKLLRASCDGEPVTISSYEDIEEFDVEWEETTGHTITRLIVNAMSQQTFRPYPMTSESKTIKVRYHARPILLGWDEDDSLEELTISSMWDDGLQQYVIGQAFLDYGDESSTTRAGTALGIYNKTYVRAMKLSKKSFSKRVITTKFQGRVASAYSGGRHGSSNCRFGY